MSLHGAERPLELAADQQAIGADPAACVCQHEPESHQGSEAHSAASKIRQLSQLPVIGNIFRFSSWWLVFFGIYASSSVCVFCGTPGCPVGAGAAAMVGGVFACLWQYGKSAWEKFRGFVAKSSR